MMEIFMFLVSFALDPSLGRVDKASLSQETLMELFMEGLNAEFIRGPDENPRPFKEWKGIKVDDSANVIEIGWFGYGPVGSISLQYIPLTVKRVSIGMTQLHGSLDLRELPGPLIDLHLYCNSFSGTVDLGYLPENLQILSLSRNKLYGTLCLERLSESLLEVQLQLNSFSGTVCLTRLPSKLRVLWLAINQLSGTLDLTKLPPTMLELYLHDNEFEGITDFSQLPRRLDRLNISDNEKLSGEVSNYGGELMYDNTGVTSARESNAAH